MTNLRQQAAQQAASQDALRSDRDRWQRLASDPDLSPGQRATYQGLYARAARTINPFLRLRVV